MFSTSGCGSSPQGWIAGCLEYPHSRVPRPRCGEGVFRVPVPALRGPPSAVGLVRIGTALPSLALSPRLFRVLRGVLDSPGTTPSCSDGCSRGCRLCDVLAHPGAVPAQREAPSTPGAETPSRTGRPAPLDSPASGERRSLSVCSTPQRCPEMCRIVRPRTATIRGAGTSLGGPLVAADVAFSFSRACSVVLAFALRSSSFAPSHPGCHSRHG